MACRHRDQEKRADREEASEEEESDEEEPTFLLDVRENVISNFSVKDTSTADKELARIRRKFVDGISGEVISQLLDDLLDEGVLNDGEKDSILQKNNSIADRARTLTDIVRKKGSKASNKMIYHLQHRDPMFFTELGLSCTEPAAPAPDPPSWSDTLKPASQEFWRKKLNDKSIYPVSSNNMKSRMALLITNIEFSNPDLNRNGANKDEENMEKLLTDLGYEVEKHTNLTGQEIDNAFKKFSKHPKLKETDSVFVVIMSHGKLGAVLGVNWKHGDEKPDEFPIDNIYQHLGSKKCPALLNKPKVIIIQACRGEDEGSVLVSDSPKAVVCDEAPQPGPSASASEGDIEGDTLQVVHKEKDFTALLSCTPDTVSYRHKERGSFLIQYTVEVFNTYAHQDDIEELFRKVMERFEDFSPRNKRQMPTKHRCTLTKRFYLFPGLRF